MEAHKAGKALLAAFVKQGWQEPPDMEIRSPKMGKGNMAIRRLLAALDAALDKLGDPGDRGFDDLVDVKISRAADSLMHARA
jgi:hypothetical protein